MKSFGQYLQNWLNPLVFAAWAIFLMYMVMSRRYAAFVRPEFAMLLTLAHFVAMGFMVAAVSLRKTTTGSLSSILGALVLLMPILCATAVGDTELGEVAFKKRYVGHTGLNMATYSQSSSVLPTIEPHPSVQSYLKAEGIEEREEVFSRTILEILLAPKMYAGKRILFEGMIVREDKLKTYFGGKEVAVYRFLMRCCAADVIPLAIALDSDQLGAFTNDQWVQVEGIFDFRQIDGKPVPLVSTPIITPVSKPSIPYMF